jgi:hypothetical protein
LAPRPHWDFHIATPIPNNTTTTPDISVNRIENDFSLRYQVYSNGKLVIL